MSDLTRRELLKRAGVVGSAALLPATLPASAQAEPRQRDQNHACAFRRACFSTMRLEKHFKNFFAYTLPGTLNAKSPGR